MRAGNRICTRSDLAVTIGKTDHGKFAKLKPKTWWTVSLRRKQLVGPMRNKVTLHDRWRNSRFLEMTQVFCWPDWAR